MTSHSQPSPHHALAEEKLRPKAAEEAQPHVSMVQKLLKVAAIPIALASGYWATKTELRAATNRLGTAEGMFDDIDAANRSAKNPLIKARINNEISREEYLEKTTAIRLRYRAAIDDRMQHMGQETFLEKLRYVKRSAAQKAIIDGLTVSGVALGVLLTLADSKSLTELLSPKASDEPNASR